MSFDHKEMLRSYTNEQLRALIADPVNNDAAAIAAAKYILEIERNGQESDMFEGLVDAGPIEDIVMARWKLVGLFAIALFLTGIALNLWSAYRLYSRELGMSIFTSPIIIPTLLGVAYLVTTAVLFYQRKPWGWILFYLNALLLFVCIMLSVIGILLQPKSYTNNFWIMSVIGLIACMYGSFVYVFFQRRALRYFDVSSGGRTRTIIAAVCFLLLFFSLFAMKF